MLRSPENVGLDLKIAKIECADGPNNIVDGCTTSWTPKTIYGLILTGATLFMVGIAFLIYGMVHVNVDSNAMVPLINSMRALQGVQMPLLMAENAAYRLSVAIDAANITMLVPFLKAQIGKLSIATDQVDLTALNAVDPVLGASIYDLLLIPRYQWSLMIADANASTSLAVLPVHYSTQLPYSESITGVIDSVSGTTAERLLDKVDDVLLLIVGAAVFLGIVFTASMVLVAAHVLTDATHTERLLTLVAEVVEQRDLAETSVLAEKTAVLAEKTAVLAKDRFLTVVSHEIRTPMNGVLGPLQLLSDAMDSSSELQPLVRTSIAAAEVLLATINNMLDYRSLLNTLDSSSNSSAVVSINFSALLSDIDALIRPSMSAKHLRYLQFCHTSDPNADPLASAISLGSATTASYHSRVWPSRVWVDRAALSQIMMILLSNAHKYTPAMGTVSTVTTLLGVHMHPCVFPRRHSVKIGSGPSRLTIISTTMPEVSIEMANLNVEIDGGCVDGAVSKRNDIEVAHARFRIEITDTGIGIPPDQLKSVFTAFSGVNQTMTRAADGLGLGLAIATELAVKKLHTQISVVSVLGHGSTFSFELDLPIDTEVISLIDTCDTPCSVSISVPSSPIFHIKPSTPLHSDRASTPNIFGLLPRTPLHVDLVVSTPSPFTSTPREPQPQPSLTPIIAPTPVIATSTPPATPARLGLPRAKERIAGPTTFTFSALPTLPRVVELEEEEPAPAPALTRRASLTSPAVANSSTLSRHINKPATTPAIGLANVAIHRSSVPNSATTAVSDPLTSPHQRLMMRQFRAVTTTTSPSMAYYSAAATLAFATRANAYGVSARAFLQLQSADVHSATGTPPKSSGVPQMKTHTTDSDSDAVIAVATTPRVTWLPGMEGGVAASARLTSSRPSLGTGATPRLNPALPFLKSVTPHSLLIQTASATGTPVLQCDPDSLPTPRSSHEVVNVSSPVALSNAKRAAATFLARHTPLPASGSHSGGCRVVAATTPPTPGGTFGNTVQHVKKGPILSTTHAGAPPNTAFSFAAANSKTPTAAAAKARTGEGGLRVSSGSVALVHYSPPTLNSSPPLDASPPFTRANGSLESPLAVLQTPALHILLVEDNLLNQKVAMAMLAKMGHSVVLAEDGQQAVDKWRDTLSAATLKLLPPSAPKMSPTSNTPTQNNVLTVSTPPVDPSVPKMSPSNVTQGIAPQQTKSSWTPVATSLEVATLANTVRSSTPDTVLNVSTLVFDICLMDLSMPVMDGLTAATTIRALEKILAQAGLRFIPLPIVAVSANSIESKPQCLAVGMQGYIAKPIRKTELAQNLHTFGCGRHSSTSPLVAASPQASPQLATPAVSSIASGTVSPATDAAGIPPLHVLLVEDNLLNQQFAISMLTRMGHSVVLAENGLDALDRWRTTLGPKHSPTKTTTTLQSLAPESVPAAASAWSTPESRMHPTVSAFDICLMDLAMPVMEGLTATRIIRAIEQSMSQAGDQIIPLHIVAVSVNSIESKPLCLAAGMQGFIEKPIHKSELVQHLRAFACNRTTLSPAVRMTHLQSVGHTNLTSPATGIPQGLTSHGVSPMPKRSPESAVPVGQKFAEPPVVFPNTSRQALTMHPLGTRHIHTHSAHTALRHSLPSTQVTSASISKNGSGKSAIHMHKPPSLPSTPENTITSGILAATNPVCNDQSQTAGPGEGPDTSPVKINNTIET